jgi:hypothetical protein
MKLLIVLSISSLTLLLSACDCAYDYTYNVENQSSTTIKVRWEETGFTSGSLIDSTTISPGSTVTIFSPDHGIEPCRTGPFFREVTSDLTSIRITKDDSIETKIDFMESDNWLYEEGLYKAVVADSSF